LIFLTWRQCYRQGMMVGWTVLEKDPPAVALLEGERNGL
jgi:hypothetical protein